MSVHMPAEDKGKLNYYIVKNCNMLYKIWNLLIINIFL